MDLLFFTLVLAIGCGFLYLSVRNNSRAFGLLSAIVFMMLAFHLLLFDFQITTAINRHYVTAPGPSNTTVTYENETIIQETSSDLYPDLPFTPSLFISLFLIMVSLYLLFANIIVR